MGKGWKKAGKLEVAQKRGQVFTKLAREIAVAAKLGGPDPEGNARLKMAIAAARAASCPKDNIERAIKKGSGTGEGGDISELTYEGYGPHQVGVIVDCQTDNKNRTVMEVKTAFKKNNGNLGESGSVAWMFERVCLVTGKKENVEDAEEDAIEAGASDVEPGDEPNEYNFYGEVSDLSDIRDGLMARGFEVTAAELSYQPKNITDLDEAQKADVHDFLAALDDLDDTHRIHATIKD